MYVSGVVTICPLLSVNFTKFSSVSCVLGTNLSNCQKKSDETLDMKAEKYVY
jgi:hypothetical protein